LSRQNNTAELAHAALCNVTNTNQAEIIIACQQDGFDWIEIAA
jgi:hypothetical protein